METSIEIMKKKFETGNYFVLWKMKDDKKGFWIQGNTIKVFKHKDGFEFKLIHKKHRNILDAYLDNENIYIINKTDSINIIGYEWINIYDEDKNYELAKPEEWFKYTYNFPCLVVYGNDDIEYGKIATEYKEDENRLYFGISYSIPHGWRMVDLTELQFKELDK